MADRKILYMRSKFESPADALKREDKIAQLAKREKTSWSGAVRIMVDSYSVKK